MMAENLPNVLLENAIKNGEINCYDYCEFSSEEKIANGAYGSVSKSEWKNGGLTVALKSLIVYTGGKEFIKELKLLQSVSFHANINHLYGVTKDLNGIYKFVLHFANNGNLRDYLNKKFSILQWGDKFRIAKEIAQGLSYLHSKGIIHRDLNPKNILVHDDKIMISDFGLAKLITSDKSTSRSNNIGMPAFSDPQSFMEHKFTTKSDIYSLGVVLWEISSGRKPFQLLNEFAIVILVNSGEREKPIEGTPPEYIELYTRCWDKDPEKRPPIKEVYESLEQFMYDSYGKPLGKLFEQVISRKIVDFYKYNEFSNHEKISKEKHELVYKYKVYKSKWRDSIVALKCFTSNDKYLNKKVVDELDVKLKFLQRTKHPNIIEFYGLTKDPSSGYYSMIFQFAHGGNLRDYLTKKFSELQWKEKLHMAIGIAEGIKHLHKDGITHCALHSNNILVCQGRMLIAGFGIFELTDESLSISTVQGKSAYIEPECLTNPTYQRDMKSDIFSLSIILWEISSGRPPFESLENRYKIAIHVSTGRRETPAENTPPQYEQLYKRCWDEDSKKRPDIISVLESLNQLLSEHQV